LLTIPHPPSSTLLPYTTLFRSPCSGRGAYVWETALVLVIPAHAGIHGRQALGTWPVISGQRSRHEGLASSISCIFQARLYFLMRDRKSTRLNSSHVKISYAVFC